MCIRDRRSPAGLGVTACNLAITAIFPFQAVESPFMRCVYAITCQMHIFMRQTIVLADPELRSTSWSTRLTAAWCFADLRLSQPTPTPRMQTVLSAVLHLTCSVTAAVVLFFALHLSAEFRPTPATTELSSLALAAQDPIWWARYFLGGIYFFAQLMACDSVYRVYCVALGVPHGLILPENFVAPWSALSTSDLWSRRWDLAMQGLLKDLSLIHISEPTRLLSISYAVFCLKKNTLKQNIKNS
eukprot:TRINITY_DN16849_c0_g1_i1.p1 TRINITY_DN16849_c0_g1~~TRINITY_DN16849_c0_g1_i1.p1  ORF type:complete len:243 (-),score=36.06 TRINITY_DN16849_c0_g1_i1:26-754(-)